MTSESAPQQTDRVERAGPFARARGDLYVCTWLYAESEAEQSSYPQVPGSAASESFQATYWRCVAVFFASSWRHQPTARHVLFTNVQHVPVVDGVDIAALLERLGVEVVQLALTHETPPGHFHAWRNQFYVLDMVAYLADRIAEEDAAIVLDSDCVWIADAGSIHEAIERDGALAYVESYEIDWDANGLTRTGMRDLADALLEGGAPYPLVYCGGEFLAATGLELRRLEVELEAGWNSLLDRSARGQQAFNEEAQLLSHVYYKLRYPVGNGDPFVRRIWTGSFGLFNTALPHDLGLVVWHLPFEKRFGIPRLFPEAADPSSWFWSIELGHNWRRELGARLGVPRNPLSKQLRDLRQRVADKIRTR